MSDSQRKKKAEPAICRHISTALKALEAEQYRNRCAREGLGASGGSATRIQRAEMELAETAETIAFFETLRTAELREVYEDGSLRHVLAKGTQLMENDRRPPSPPITITHSLGVGFLVPDDREFVSWAPGGATAFGLALIAADANALARKAREDAEYERKGPMGWEDDERAQDWRRRHGSSDEQSRP